MAQLAFLADPPLSSTQGLPGDVAEVVKLDSKPSRPSLGYRSYEDSAQPRPMAGSLSSALSPSIYG